MLDRETLIASFKQVVNELKTNPDDFKRIDAANTHLFKTLAKIAEDDKGDGNLQYLLAVYKKYDPKDLPLRASYKLWLEYAVKKGEPNAHIEMAVLLVKGELYPVNIMEAGRLIAAVLNGKNNELAQEIKNKFAEVPKLEKAYLLYSTKNNPAQASAKGLLELAIQYWKEFLNYAFNQPISKNPPRNEDEAFRREKEILELRKFETRSLRLFDTILNSEEKEVIAEAQSYIAQTVSLQNSLKQFQTSRRIPSICSISDYYTMINNQLSDKKQVPEIQQAYDLIHQQLTDAKSSLSMFLHGMTEENKIKLLTALIANDASSLKEYLESMFKQLGLSSAILPDVINHMAEHSSKQFFSGAQWVNPLVKKIIDNLFIDGAGKKMQTINRGRLLRAAMQSLADDLFDMPAKLAICESIDRESTNKMTHLNYTESLPPLRLEMKAEKRIFKLDDPLLSADALFMTSLKSNLDSSEFILLTTAYLEAILGDQFTQKTLLAIQHAYLNIDYKLCLELLNNLCQQNKDEISTEAKEAMNSNAALLIRTQFGKNYNRRFFENRICQYGLGKLQDTKEPAKLDSIYLQSINKIFEYFAAFSIQSLSELNHAINTISELPDEKALTRMYELQAESLQFAKRRTLHKDLVSTKAKASRGEFGYNIFSSNRGLMVSSQSAYYNELSQKELKNRIVDVRTLSDENSYSYLNRRSAYAGSISGHAFFLVALLEIYMSKHKNESAINEDVNRFVHVFIMSYMSQGYHSFLEVMDVFIEPKIKSIFRKYGVTVDTQFSNHFDIVTQAFYDAQEYAKHTCIKQANLMALMKTTETLRTSKQASLHALIGADPLTLKVLEKIEQYIINGIYPDVENQITLSNKMIQDTSLFRCIENNLISLLDFFIKNGMKFNFVLESKNEDYNGLTPLQFAAKKGYTTALEKLCEAKDVDVHLVNQDGKTALDFAVENGKFMSALILIKQGAAFGQVNQESFIQFINEIENKTLTQAEKDLLYEHAIEYASKRTALKEICLALPSINKFMLKTVTAVGRLSDGVPKLR